MTALQAATAHAGGPKLAIHLWLSLLHPAGPQKLPKRSAAEGHACCNWLHIAAKPLEPSMATSLAAQLIIETHCSCAGTRRLPLCGKSKLSRVMPAATRPRLHTYSCCASPAGRQWPQKAGAAPSIAAQLACKCWCILHQACCLLSCSLQRAELRFHLPSSKPSHSFKLAASLQGNRGCQCAARS